MKQDTRILMGIPCVRVRKLTAKKAYDTGKTVYLLGDIDVFYFNKNKVPMILDKKDNLDFESYLIKFRAFNSCSIKRCIYYYVSENSFKEIIAERKQKQSEHYKNLRKLNK